MGTWNVDEAKSRFEELIQRAMQDAPQMVADGTRVLVKVLAISDSSSILNQEDGFADYLLRAPKVHALVAAPRRSRCRPPPLGD